MVTSAARPEASATPPDRPCDQGHRNAWRRDRSGGWFCGTCARTPAPPTDDHGLPLLMRHECSKMGCHLAADDEGEPVIAPFVAAATIMVSGPLLLRCPACRGWARVLRVAGDGRQACERCAGG